MIKPTGNWILVEELPRPLISDEGIHYPDNYERYQHGEQAYRVVAVGPKADREIQPGGRVVLDQFRCQAKNQCGKHQWLVQDTSCSLFIPLLKIYD